LTKTEKVKFPKTFWTANIVELFERAAYYGMFIFLTIYLTDIVGFSDIWAGIIGAVFSAGVYFFPLFVGAYSDRIGFRKALILAFALLSIGYLTMGIFHYKSTTLPALAILMFGGAFIKSVITATVAKTSSEKNRARAYSIFYSMVNAGAFFGKLVAKPIRMELGIEYIGIYSGIMTILALVMVFIYFQNVNAHGEGKKLKEITDGLIRVFKSPRLMVLILIVSGFWMIQQQMYASMPKFIMRMVGPDAAPEWYANINPMMVMIFVMVITQVMRRFKAITSVTVGMLIMPLSTLLMAGGPMLQESAGNAISIFGLFNMHPYALMMVFGISLQGLAECFITPRYLEYFSIQSPKGEEGMYLGFAHLHTFFSNIIGVVLSGFLLDIYCPDPHKPEFAGLNAAELALKYEHAHFLWYYFAAIGTAAAISLLIYSVVVKRIDSRKQSLATH
jgi:dipeptide/tripeptide permease